ncbi:hypothetical protein CEUSTIGMA_g6336.t1 [Chlamydomonas eustigma]|uniref:Uncharacterized protein n=1 Tax=Chlamydomonas eustigma TaxID=1157962 RepID=A0A250X748_9CHLO|nr:hypothetical protein CEUSTIGMA_g6336.t1 [Chlamydomonas eustigma]|eukprot:GAX78897.1 hypothetical protein CEUSTIGMA_g6336.t1 [Chlamydomonas eustigma]
MATGIVFLQSSLDESSPNVVSSGYKPGNTDLIRLMLREQQKSSKALHSNALFKEFRDEGKHFKKFGKGYAVAQQEATQPMIDDFQAEGNSRMFQLIKSTAEREEKPLQGVWASFGKPYISQGPPEEPDSTLPKLNRDEINQEAKGSRNGRSKPKQEAEPPPPTAAPPFPPGSAMRMGMDQSDNAADSRAVQLEEDRLTKNKTIMRFSDQDKLETKFPKGPLLMADYRRTKSKIKIGAFNDPYQADEEAHDPELAYGQPVRQVTRLVPMALPDRKDVMDGGRSQVFITQGTADPDNISDPFLQRGLSMSGPAGPTGVRQSTDGRSDQSRFSYHMRMSVSGVAGALKAPQDAALEDEISGAPEAGHGPAFTPLVNTACPPRGQEDNPVYGWHNKFVEVRQRGRTTLQQALYGRSEGRYKARSFEKMTANLCGLLMGDLDQVRGRKVPYASVGVEPKNPYLKMEAEWSAQEQSRKMRTQRALALDPEELKALQKFYDQLCSLVEAQRMSDPLSLMVVHKIRSLLEAGMFLHKPLLLTVLEHIGNFTKGCGLMRHNKYILSILLFIAKSANISEADLDEHVAMHGMSIVVYGTSETPLRATASASKAATVAQRATMSAFGKRLASAANEKSSGRGSIPFRDGSESIGASMMPSPTTSVHGDLRQAVSPNATSTYRKQSLNPLSTASSSHAAKAASLSVEHSQHEEASKAATSSSQVPVMQHSASMLFSSAVGAYSP